MKLLFAILLALLLSSCINYSGGKFFFNNGTCRDGEYMSKCGALLWVCLFGVSPTSEIILDFLFIVCGIKPVVQLTITVEVIE